MFVLTALLVVLSTRQEPNHAHLSARFVDAAGRAVAGANVLNRFWPGAESLAASDASGHVDATIEWAANHGGTWYECSVRVLGCARWDYHGDLVPGQDLDLGTVRLEPGGAVGGRVLLGSTPASEAWLLVVPAQKLPAEAGRRFETGAPTGPAYFVAGVKSPDYEKPIDRGTSASDGTFHIIGLPPGRYGIWARSAASFLATTTAFDVRVGEETKLPDLVLEALPPEHWIEGRVEDPDGAPIAGAHVQGSAVDMGIDCFEVETHSGPDGHFGLAVLTLSCGAFELRAEVDDKRFSPISLSPVEVGRHDVVMKFARPREIRLTVIDPEGHAVEDFGWDQGPYANPIEAHHPGGRAIARLEDPESDSITIGARGFAEQAIPVTASTLELTVTLQPVARDEVSGWVTFHGQPSVGAHVDLVLKYRDSADGLTGRSWNGTSYAVGDDQCVTTDAAGRFRIPNDWPAYHYRVRAWASGSAPAYSSEVQGSAADLQLALQDGGVLTGRVRLPNDERSGGTVLHAFQVESDSLDCSVGREFRTRTDESGSYRFEHLEAGAWLIAAELSPGELQRFGWTPQDGTTCRETLFFFELDEGRVTKGDIDLSLPRGPCRLQGRLTVGNQIREGYASLQLTGEQELGVAFSGLDSDGRFELTTRTPGAFRLVINAGPGHHRSRLVTDLVTLAPGETRWERSLTLEEWKEDGVRLDHP